MFVAQHSGVSRDVPARSHVFPSAVKQENVQGHELLDLLAIVLSDVQTTPQLAVQVEEGMQRLCANISTLNLHIRSGNAGRGSGFASFVVDDTPQINGGQEEAFSCANRKESFLFEQEGARLVETDGSLLVEHDTSCLYERSLLDETPGSRTLRRCRVVQ